MLIDHNASLEVNQIVTGTSLFHFCAMTSGNVETTKFVFRNLKLNINAANEQGETPLDIARESMKYDLVKFIQRILDEGEADPILQKMNIDDLMKQFEPNDQAKKRKKQRNKKSKS